MKLCLKGLENQIGWKLNTKFNPRFLSSSEWLVFFAS